MSENSTFRAQFLADIDQVRRLRRRFWLTVVLMIFGSVLFLIAASVVHPVFIVVCVLPVIALRIVWMQLHFIRCPRCGEFFYVNPKPLELGMRRKWSSPFIAGSRCVRCDFML